MSLYLTVSPGYRFSESELVTYAKLNQLGTPILNLGGSIESGDVGAGAITLEKIADGIDLASKMPDASIGLEKLASGTHGSILYCDSAGQWQQLGPGSDGQFLKTQGPDADPVWANQQSLSAIPISMITPEGANKQLVTDDSNTVVWEAKPAYEFAGMATMWEEQPTNTSGGTTTAADQTRVLNQFSDPGGILSDFDATNYQFELTDGTYHFKGRAPAANTGNHTCWIYNVTDGAIAVSGSSAQGGSSKNTETQWCFVEGIYEVVGTKLFEFRFRSTSTSSTGLGRAANIPGQVEIYSQLTVTKIG